MEYLESNRDRDTLQAVLIKVTSVNLMTGLTSVQDKRNFQRARGLVGAALLQAPPSISQAENRVEIHYHRKNAFILVSLVKN